MISVGVSAHGDDVDEVTPEIGYRHICGYVHVFAEETAYRRWAADADATTTALPDDRGVGVANGFAADLS